jgi:catechol 2,3-dioxygenase-like lactoylglutathione lyase family enzyme
MSIIGVETALFGVEDLELSTRYFVDFGLKIHDRNERETHFRLEEGSNVILRPLDDPSIPASSYVGPGVKETIWGVDTQQSLDRLGAGLAVDREVRKDPDGTLHCLSDCGMALGFRVYRRQAVTFAPDPVNAPFNVQRLNVQRKWRLQANPKTLNHVVFESTDYQSSFEFFRDRLQFRLSDYQNGLGIFGRCDGRNEHHSIYLLNAFAPGLSGRPKFNHIAFGVEDIDELMIGTNYMTRRGWKQGFLKLGRHRVDSALFSYLGCPAGGEAEYEADQDYIDDSWVPREWEANFGTATWIDPIPFFLEQEPAWDVHYMDGSTPAKKEGPDWLAAAREKANAAKTAARQAVADTEAAGGFSRLIPRAPKQA